MYIFRLLVFILNMLVKILKNVTGFGATKMVLIVRTDLKMSQGKIASQCAHAAISLYESAVKSDNDTIIQQWLSRGQPKIVLKIDKDCENTLLKLYNDAKNSGLNSCLVRDAGKTQVEHGTLTVLGIGPNITTEVDKITAHLKLL